MRGADYSTVECLWIHGPFETSLRFCFPQRSFEVWRQLTLNPSLHSPTLRCRSIRREKGRPQPFLHDTNHRSRITGQGLIDPGVVRREISIHLSEFAAHQSRHRRRFHSCTAWPWTFLGSAGLWGRTLLLSVSKQINVSLGFRV